MKRTQTLLKNIIKVIIGLPFVLIVLVIAFEILGMIVNHLSTSQQTKGLKKILKEEFASVEIIDSYMETGNTSGTGNHVDMLSVVIFKTDETLSDIQNKLNEYYELDEWGLWTEEMARIKENYDSGKCKYFFYDELYIPEQLEHCYLVYLNQNAPFSDNIEGH